MDKKEKRYYWMKLTEDFMLSENGPLDFLMTSSPNGARYVVLYQMLCLKTINTCGVFVTVYGEIVVKLTIDKIKKDCKYFSPEEIVIALELFKRIGLVIEDEKGLMEIKDHASLIGSETDAAQRMRKSRLKKSALELPQKECNTECNNVTHRYKDNKIEETIHDSSNNLLLCNTYSMCLINNIDDSNNSCNTECNAAVTKDTHTTTLGKYKNVIVPLDWLEKFKATYGQGYANLVIERLSLYKEAHNIPKQNDVPYLERFAEEDKAKQNDANSTFETEEFFEAALKRSYEFLTEDKED